MFISRRQLETLLIIGLGGFVGANARYWVSGWAAEKFGSAFPWGTLIINFSGSCLLGVFTGWSANHVRLDPQVRLLVAIGFFGAYTTFSTYANDSARMLQAGEWIGALGNILGSNLICIIGAMAGLALGAKLP